MSIASDIAIKLDFAADYTRLFNAQPTQDPDVVSLQASAGFVFGKAISINVTWKDGANAPAFTRTKQVTLNVGIKI